jgi:hypothetical protein
VRALPWLALPCRAFVGCCIASSLCLVPPTPNSTTQTSAHSPALQYYYLGFYIHTCSKMRYKGAYEPSELLCPVTLQWAPLARCRPILDKRPYARLAAVEGETEEAEDEGEGVVEAAMEEEEEEEDGEEEDEQGFGQDDEDDEEEEDEDDGRYGLHVPLTPEEVSALGQVAMDVGPLAALPPRSQQMLLPILREFVAHVTPALVPRLLVKLRP